jgi:hypothetical protein
MGRMTGGAVPMVEAIRAARGDLERRGVYPAPVRALRSPRPEVRSRYVSGV